MIVFDKSFTQQESIPEAGIDAAVEVLRSGRLHRYNTAPNEPGETNLLEQAFAQYMGFCRIAWLVHRAAMPFTSPWRL